MKKYLLFGSCFFTLLTFLSFSPAHADEPTASLDKPTVTLVSDSTAKAVFNGTFNSATGDIISSLTSKRSLIVLYGPAGDTGKPDIDTLTTAYCGSSPTCNITYNKDNSGTFTVTLTSLHTGNYVAIPYFNDDNNGDRLPIGTSIGTTFTVTGATPPTATFNSASVAGNTVSVQINFANVLSTPKISAYAELGYGKQNGNTNQFSCTPSGSGLGTSSKGIDIPPGNSTQTFVINSVGEGIYCVRVRGGGTDGKQLQKVGVDNNDFFMASGALIAVGKELPPGATNNPSANARGCVQGDNNAGYCLLAPLPGVGDPNTGYLDVNSGIGNYINMIIKLVMGIIGVLSVLMIVIGGIEYMSTVNLGEKEGARNRITSALFGLLLTLSAYILLYTINPNLVNLVIRVPGGTIMASQAPGEDGLSVNEKVAPTGNYTVATNDSGQDLTTCDQSNLETIYPNDLDQGMGIFKNNIPIKLNKGLKASLIRVFAKYKQSIANKPSLASYKIDTSAGGYFCKQAKGGNYPSAHSFGLALDINAPANGFSGANVLKTDIPTELVQAFTSEGWGWGGNWIHVKDPMHFSKMRGAHAEEQGSGPDSYHFK